MKTISVITISFNALAHIEKTIQSVIKQKYNKFEYIVVDGKSNDGTVSIIRKYDNNIDKWISEPDTGIYNAMNKAVKLATGKYCIFMNAGDTFLHDKVLYEVDKYLETDIDIISGNNIITSNNKLIAYSKPPKVITFNYLFNSSLCHQSTFIKRQLLIDIPYDETLRMVSDWKFWIQTLIFKNSSYLSIDVDICNFDGRGITYTQSEKGNIERNMVFKELIPQRIIDDYISYSHQYKKKFMTRLKRKIFFFLSYYSFKLKHKKEYNV